MKVPQALAHLAQSGTGVRLDRLPGGGEPAMKKPAYAALVTAYCRDRGYAMPVFEHEFHPERRWRLDISFPWAAPPLAVEVHGGVHAGGRHTRGTGFTRDREKINAAVCLGWRVLEVTTEQLTKGDLWPMLDTLLSSKGD